MDNMVKVLCVVQARLTSSRLPNKVLTELGNSGLSLLEHVNSRLHQSRYIEEVAFAIPDTAENDALAEFLDSKGIPYFRGSEDDVLERFYLCAKKYNPELVVRATCDNPCVDWQLTDMLIENIGDADYSYCYDAPLGTPAEVFTMESLEQAYVNSTGDIDREHVTPYIKRNGKVLLPKYNGLSYRLTVDEENDLKLTNIIYNELYHGQPIPNTDIYHYLSNHPEVAMINQKVHQKQLGE